MANTAHSTGETVAASRHTATRTSRPATIQAVSPADRPLELADEAARAVALGAPRIEDLGRQLAAVEEAAHQFDSAFLKPQHDRVSDDARVVLGERGDALRLMISTLPAATVADAAVQVSQILDLTDQLRFYEGDEDERRNMIARIERMALGMRPVLAQAAGLDMAKMGWARQDGCLRVSRWRGAGVTE